MRRLRKEELREFHGELLTDMVEFRPTKEVVSYVRRWLTLFPYHEDAPDLVGKWLESAGSNEAAYVAARYVDSVAEARSLHWILLGAKKMRRAHGPLFRTIERRLELDYRDGVWARLQRFKSGTRATDRIVKRWLDLNQDNTHLLMDVSSVALFSESLEVIQSALRWAEGQDGNAEYFGWVWTHFLEGRSSAHRVIRPRVIELARAWTRRHENDRKSGQVLACLLSATGAPDDIDYAIRWYRKQKRSESAWHVLSSLLWLSKWRGEAPDSFVVSETMKLLRKQTAENRIPVLAGALLAASPNAQSIALARQVCIESRLAWLIADLLRVAPDAELVERGLSVLPHMEGSEVGEKLLTAILSYEPHNEQALRFANRWARKKRNPKFAASVKKLLSDRRQSHFVSASEV